MCCCSKNGGGELARQGRLGSDDKLEKGWARGSSPEMEGFPQESRKLTYHSSKEPLPKKVSAQISEVPCPLMGPKIPPQIEGIIRK